MFTIYVIFSKERLPRAVRKTKYFSNTNVVDNNKRIFGYNLSVIGIVSMEI